MRCDECERKIKPLVLYGDQFALVRGPIWRGLRDGGFRVEMDYNRSFLEQKRPELDFVYRIYGNELDLCNLEQTLAIAGRERLAKLCGDASKSL
jgi:hypothetical protein